MQLKVCLSLTNTHSSCVDKHPFTIMHIMSKIKKEMQGIFLFVPSHMYSKSGPHVQMCSCQSCVSLVFIGVEQCVNRMCNAVCWSCAAARAGWQQHCRLQ